MNIDLILEKILKKYGSRISDSTALEEITEKLKKGVATYADAYTGAQETGKILTDLFREYLPSVLVDGQMPKDVASMIIKPSMLKAGEDVSDLTAQIQKQLNEKASIGMNPIIPEQNEDQIDGIIDYASGLDDFEAHEENVLDMVEHQYESQVDDFVHDNAEFHYQCGLSPKIERVSSGKCCAWCDGLVGTYEYSEVRNTGNDVFRRHKNCHCVVLYNPANGSKNRQNVHTKKWV